MADDDFDWRVMVDETVLALAEVHEHLVLISERTLDTEVKRRSKISEQLLNNVITKLCPNGIRASEYWNHEKGLVDMTTTRNAIEDEPQA